MLSQPPVFILSCYRSGSTLLRYVLDSHSEVYSPPELSLGQTAEFLGHFYAGLEGSRFDSERPEAMSPQVIDRIRAVLAAAAAEALQSKGKSVFCEKSPSNVLYLRLLEALFPSARYLCLHRHARDVVASTIKMHAGIPELAHYVYAEKGDLVTAFVTYWTEWTSSLLAFEQANPQRCFRLRYEDLVADPRGRAAEVFAFLGLDWDPGLIDSVFNRQHDAGREDPYIRFSTSIHTSSIGAGQGLSLSHVRGDLLGRMEAALQTLGYTGQRGGVSAEPGSRAALGDGEMPSLKWFFETHVPRRIEDHPDLAQAVSASFEVAIRGGTEGCWRFEQAGGALKVIPGPGGGDRKITVSAEDLFGIARGQINPRKAFEDGRLRVEGDFALQDLVGLVSLLHLSTAA